MKLRRPEPRPRRVPAIETLGGLEREQDDLDRLHALWNSPLLRQGFMQDIRETIGTWTESKQQYFNLAEMVRDITLLTSAFGQPAIEAEVFTEAKMLVRSHEIFREPLTRSFLAKAGTSRILYWSNVVTAFPEERSRLVIPDDIFINWLEKYAADGKLAASFKAMLFASMAILKPEQVTVCRAKLEALGPTLWARRTFPSLELAETLAACRLLQPDLYLSSAEKDKLFDELNPTTKPGGIKYRRVHVSHIAAAAILLASKAEIVSGGNILIRPKSANIGQPVPLPDRSQV